MITIGHIDDHRVILVAVAAWLEREAPDIQVLASTVSVQELIEALPEPPDVVVLDPVLRDGTEFAANVVRLHEWGTRIVVSTSDTSTPAFRTIAFREDVAAFVEKRTDAEELLTAIRAAAAGRRHETEEWTRHLGLEPVSLTPRERAVIRLYAVGMTFEEGGRALEISRETFKWHIENVRGKYREVDRPVRTRADLTDQVRRDGHLADWDRPLPNGE